MKVVLRGDGRDTKWRIVRTVDGVFHLQKKGVHGRRWVEAGHSKATSVNSIRYLTRSVTANWY